PNNDVGGNCGHSWIYEIALGGLRVQINTGFHVIAIAVSYEWKYWMGDQGGVTSHTHSGALASTDWSILQTWAHLTAGSASAWVDTSGHAWALLNTGAICVSGGPSDHTTIF